MSLTDPEFYANHTDAQLAAVINKAAADGAFIATNSGATHPLALEWAAIWAAAVTAEALRKGHND